MSEVTLLNTLRNQVVPLASERVVIGDRGQLEVLDKGVFETNLIELTPEHMAENKKTAHKVVAGFKKEKGEMAARVAEGILWNAQFNGHAVTSRHIELCFKAVDQLAVHEKAKPVLPYGLKALQENWEKFSVRAGSLAKALKDRTVAIGRYRLGKVKDKGVEPGFVGYKLLTADDRKKIRSLDHRFSKWAAQFLLRDLQAVDKNSVTWGRLNIYLKEKKIIGKEANDFKDFQEALKDYMDEGKALSKKHADIFQFLLAGEDSIVMQCVEDWIMIKDEAFSKPHYIKLDYQETDMRKSLSGRNVKVQIPELRAKGVLHRYFTAKTPEAANFSAVRECLANDMMRVMGIYTQDLKIIRSDYEDGYPKLLLDGKHMGKKEGGQFEDFSGKIKDGYLVNEKGESDQSIDELGKYLIFFLLLGDRDAIGSRGDNKGRIGSQFAAIDPGHAFELHTGPFATNLMAFQNIHDDFSFDQPDLPGDKLTKGYKNFTIFQDRPYFEKFQGVLELERLRASGKDLEVIDAYIQQFMGGDLNFRKALIEIRDAYIKRCNDILDKVFKERLTVYHQYSARGERVLTFVDRLEKITSTVSHVSEKGAVKLVHPRVLKRVPWNVRYNSEHEDYIFSMSTKDKKSLDELKAFLKELSAKSDIAFNLQETSKGYEFSVPQSNVMALE